MFDNFKGIGGYVAPHIRKALLAYVALIALPAIAGEYFYVDPKGGSATGSGTAKNPVNSIELAYDLCTTGAGDGIVVASQGTTAAHTTSYLTQALAWSKNGITVIGLSAPTTSFMRSRVSSKEVTTGALTDISFTNSGTADYISRVTGSFVTDGFVAGQTIRVAANSGTNSGVFTILTVAALKLTLSTGDSLTTEDAATAGSTTITNYMATILNVSGDNNRFINVAFWNSDSDALSLGGLNLTGNRNTFENCHIVGGAGAAASANKYDVALSGSENAFIGGTIGTDTVDAGNNANCELYLNGSASTGNRNRFLGVEFLSCATTGTAHGAIKSAGANAAGRGLVFRDCVFHNYRPNLGAKMASVFIGTNPLVELVMVNSACPGYAAWDSNGSNECVVIAGGAASNASHGLPVTP